MSVLHPLRIPLKDDGPRARKLIRVIGGCLAMRDRPSFEAVIEARYEDWREVVTQSPQPQEG